MNRPVDATLERGAAREPSEQRLLGESHGDRPIRRHRKAAQRRVPGQGPRGARRAGFTRARRTGLHLRPAGLHLRLSERHRDGPPRPSASRATAGRGWSSRPPACCCCSAPRSTGERSRWRSSWASRFVVGALIALSDGDDILGIVAMNNWTTLVMGAVGTALILLSMMPRVGRRRGGAPVATRRDGRARRSRRRVGFEAATAGAPLPGDEPARPNRYHPRHARRPSLATAHRSRPRPPSKPRLRAEPVRHHVAPASAHGAGSVPAGLLTTMSLPGPTAAITSASASGPSW